MFGLFKRGDGKSPLKSLSGRGTILSGQMEWPCRLKAGSDQRLDVVLERGVGLSGALVVVDHSRGMALDVRVAQSKGTDITFDIVRSHDLRGLVPARLGRARDIYNRR